MEPMKFFIASLVAVWLSDKRDSFILSHIGALFGLAASNRIVREV